MVYHRLDNAATSADCRQEADKTWGNRDYSGENASDPVRNSGDRPEECADDAGDSAKCADELKSTDGRYSESYEGKHSSHEGRYSSSSHDGRHGDSSRSRNGRDEGSKYSRSSRSREDEKYSRSRDGSREDDRYSRSKDDSRDDDRYSRSRDDRREGARDKDKYDSPRHNERSRYRDSSRHDRYEEGSRRSDSSKHSDRSRYNEESEYGSESRYNESSRHHDDSRCSESSRYSDSSRYRSCRSEDYYGREGRYSSSRYDEDSKYGGESSRHWQERESEASPDDASINTYTEPEPERVRNVFQNDGSFLELFKKMQEANKPPAIQEESESEVTPATSKESTVVAAASETVVNVPKRPPLSIVGKRRGGRVLPTGMVKKQKKEEEVEETPKDAWSLYIAEVRKYKEASCEEEGKTRPLVKRDPKILKTLNLAVSGISRSFRTYMHDTVMPAIMPAVAAASKGGKDDIKLETAPFDPRFPNQNQTRYCYQSYLDYHRCQAVKGEDYEPCNYFKKVFNSICPSSWIEKWDTQIEENRFPGKIH